MISNLNANLEYQFTYTVVDHDIFCFVDIGVMKHGLLCLKWLNKYSYMYVSFIYRFTGHDSKQIQFAWYVLSDEVYCI